MTPRRLLVRLTFMLADSVVLLGSIYVASKLCGIPLRALPAQGNEYDTTLQIAFLALALVTLWLLLFSYFGLYRHRYLSFMRFRPYQLMDLVKSTSLGTLLLIGTAFLNNFNHVDTRFILTLWALDTIATLGVREILIHFLREMRLQGRNLRHVLIVGTNERARALADRIEDQPELGYALRGFVDDRRGDRRDGGKPLEIVASLDQLDRYLRDHVVDEVIITLPMATLYREAAHIVEQCEEQGVVSHFVPGFDFLSTGSTHMTFDTLNEEPILTLIPPPMKGWPLICKRFIDFFSAATLLALLSPVFVATAIAVRLTSPGPAFFVQERVGLNKRRFRLLKFRTMVVDAEQRQQELERLNEAGGPVFKIERDPRITPIGNFLRRSSLDELPQLFNVLTGEMSLVGPRPLPLRDYEGFDQDWHRRRFSVRPGMTCLWQISGRSSISFDDWMKLDMEYIKHWSLWLDFKILFATIPAVLMQRGAV